MINNKNTLMSIAVALALAACGGGGSSSPAATAAPSTGSGTAVDGYLSGSAVLCDTNKNGATDTGEQVVLTNSAGNFTFSPACTSNIVVSGGTNIDTGLPFNGVLKAQAGSTVATPLTSLMVDAGLTSAQIAAFVGLPVGSDLTKLDPAAAGNADALKKTLALQQIIQQTTNTISGLGQNSTTTSLQAVYLEVVKAVAATLLANPTASLIDASGNVASGLVNSVVQQSVTNVTTSSNTVLATVKTVVATLSPARVAGVAAAAITAQAQTLATTTYSPALVTSLQSDVTITNTLTAVATLLVPTNLQSVASVAAALTTLSSANTSLTSTPQSKAAAATALNTQASNVGQTINASTLSAPTNYLSIVNDQIAINGITYTLDQFNAGMVATSAANASLDTFAFSLLAKGNPIPANASNVRTENIKVALELSDTVASKRSLQVIIDTVTISIDANGKLSISVPATAKVYIYGQTSSNVMANLTLTNLATDLVAVDANNAVSFNMGRLFNKIVNGNNSVLSNLQYLKGSIRACPWYSA
ncbi:hypothetical protein ACVBEF_02975 [Glaciimonas sp. GG7]